MENVVTKGAAKPAEPMPKLTGAGPGHTTNSMKT